MQRFELFNRTIDTNAVSYNQIPSNKFALGSADHSCQKSFEKLMGQIPDFRNKLSYLDTYRELKPNIERIANAQISQTYLGGWKFRKKTLSCLSTASFLSWVALSSFLKIPSCISHTLHIIWQGVHLFVKLQAGGTNKETTKMKSRRHFSSPWQVHKSYIAEQLFLRNASRILLLPWNMITMSV